MVICDPWLRVRFFSCSHAGSAHDARIWNESTIFQQMKNRHNPDRPVFIIGMLFRFQDFSAQDFSTQTFLHKTFPHKTLLHKTFLHKTLLHMDFSACTQTFLHKMSWQFLFSRFFLIIKSMSMYKILAIFIIIFCAEKSVCRKVLCGKVLFGKVWSPLFHVIFVIPWRPFYYWDF